MKKKFKVDRGKNNLKFFKSNKNELIILKQETKSIQIYIINLNEHQKSNQGLDLPIEPNGRIDFSKFALSLSDLLQTVTVTNKNSILVVSLNNEILFSDLNSKNIILQLNIDHQHNTNTLKYFLTPTNLAFNKLNNIMNASNGSDDLIGLGNLNNLVFVNYEWRLNVNFGGKFLFILCQFWVERVSRMKQNHS